MRRLTLSLALLLWLALPTQARERKSSDLVVVGYVTSWTQSVPDPFTMTHLNYAFGKVNKTFDGVDISRPERLRQMVSLKQQNPRLKVILSIGGWGAGRFSEMAASTEKRHAFAADCQRIVREFHLDGIDIDWEYPTQHSAGISASPADTENFTQLIKDLRKVLGRQALLTIATVCDAKYIDLRACVPYLDFVNVMSYDMSNGRSSHHAALRPSAISAHCTSEGAVEAHLKAGVPREKLVMGIPFYGKGQTDEPGVKSFLQTHTLPEGYESRWDETAQVPYLVNPKGEFLFGYENRRSLMAKCQYILDKNLRGGMYWDYDSDNPQGDRRTVLALSLLKNKRATCPPRRVLVLAERGGEHEGFTAAALQWLQQQRERFGMDITVLNSAKELKAGQLQTFHLVLQLNYPPYAWSPAAQKDMEEYIDRGRGAYIGFHHATLLGEFDGYPLWPWFCDFMGGIRFKNYIAEKADATVCTENAAHPVMKNIPSTFRISEDEWYTYDRNPRPSVHVLAHVDEASYSRQTDVRMGDHPVIWTNTRKPARNVYFQFGHSASLLQNPTFVQLLENALEWTLAEN